MTGIRRVHGRIASAVVKLGGSVITDKRGGEPVARLDEIERLAREIAAARPARLVIVHGAGSFGHPIVERTGLLRGRKGDAWRLAWAETQCWQNLLDVQVTATLGRAGIPAVPCQPSAMSVMRDGRLARMDLPAIEGLLSLGLVPVLFGVPAFDRTGGCSILSGDVLAPFVAAKLGIGRVLHATDVDGVFDADPHAMPKAERFQRIDRRNWPTVRKSLRGSAAIDVTGGMLGKVTEAVEWARRGVRARILDATRPGRLRDALARKAVGTEVRW
jgi:isopentenyl phosphate kinase